jgi:hypothetical protein
MTPDSSRAPASLRAAQRRGNPETRRPRTYRTPVRLDPVSRDRRSIFGFSIKGKQALLFLQKKKQKNSYLLGALATPLQKPPTSRSFLVLFFKKERLPSFLTP